MTSENSPHFKTRARLLCQLGEQLIKDGSIALMELIKNAYDADASSCKILFENPESDELGTIVVLDDGSGMDRDTLLHSWLEIGTDSKREKRNGLLTPVYKRFPLGEKGVGRFGVHRLGRKIELITRKAGCKECVININWDEIDDSVYIDEIPVSLIEREPTLFIDGSGSKIKISGLRDSWDEKSIKELARQVLSLNSPFQSLDSFRASIEINNDWLKDVLTFEDVKEFGLYTFRAVIKGKEIVDFVYDFTPYKKMDKIPSKHISYDDLKRSGKNRVVRKKGRSEFEDVDLSQFEIGNVVFEGVVYDLETNVLKLGDVYESRVLKDYLRGNGGVKIFRDNMRIWDYGEAGNDWLGLNARRVNRPSSRISNNIILAAVHIDGIASSSLVEKTNREGFLENEAYREFRDACAHVISVVECYRNEDKEIIRKWYLSKPDEEKPVIDSIDEVRILIQKNIDDDILVKKLCRKLDRIGDDYTRITSDLMKSAGAGLNLVAVLHQVEKIIKNLKYNVSKENTDVSLIGNDVDTLSSLVDGYSILVRNCKVEARNLVELVNHSLNSIRFRLKDHEIKVCTPESLGKHGVFGYCSDNYFINAMMNLLDNSIWWLKYVGVKDPKIYLDVIDENSDFCTVVVADNGPGFGLSKEVLGTAFVTGKPVGLGMGIGLHLTREIMTSLKGELRFPDADEFCLPDEFKKGAVVALSFRKGK